MIGKTLGHYEIIDLLGEGGMGRVYRAHDTELNRDVALKVLSPKIAFDEARRKRFKQEARALASLNHPGIVVIHSVETKGGTDFLTMELIEGESLSEAIPRRGFSLERFLRLAAPLAEAVAAAHEHRVIHRDLKPSNIMLGDDGRVTILDFGIAKLRQQPRIDEEATTQTNPGEMTVEGELYGTVAYMSPEQAQAKPVDYRSDIFSLGVVLYEMATGERPFTGDTRGSLVAAIVEDTPGAVTDARPDFPRHVGRIIKRMLAKDPSRRYQSALDVRNELDDLRNEIESGGISNLRGARGRPPKRLGMQHVVIGALIAAAVATFAIVATIWLGPGPGLPPGLVATIVAPPVDSDDVSGPIFDMSRDGSELVYTARGTNGVELYRRPMTRLQEDAIPGTEGAYQPFYSPDGQSLGFYVDGELRRISLAGGAAIPVYKTSMLHLGATWAPDGTIYFAMGASIWKIRPSDSDPELVVDPDPSRNERAYFWPHMLPDGRGLLFTVWRGTLASASVGLLSLTSGEVSILEEQGTRPVYSGTGHLVFARGGTLFAVPFDLGELRTAGLPTSIATGVKTENNGAVHFATADDGTLVYVPGGVERVNAQLVWIDLNGVETPLNEERRAFRTPRLSPDGTRLAVRVADQEGTDILIYDLDRGFSRRFTTAGSNFMPEWSPDSEWLAFSSNRDGDYDLYRQRTDFSAGAERILTAERSQYPESFFPTGDRLLYTDLSPSSIETWVLSLDGTAATEPILGTPFSEAPGEFSPDGNWIAYVSDESGRDEIYVRPYARPGARHQISHGGGTQPVWSPDERRLFYVNGSALVSVEVQLESDFSWGDPELVASGPYFGVDRSANYDVSADGQRLIVVKRLSEEAKPWEIVAVLNWPGRASD